MRTPCFIELNSIMVCRNSLEMFFFLYNGYQKPKSVQITWVCAILVEDFSQGAMFSGMHCKSLSFSIFKFLCKMTAKGDWCAFVQFDQQLCTHGVRVNSCCSCACSHMWLKQSLTWTGKLSWVQKNAFSFFSWISFSTQFTTQL